MVHVLNNNEKESLKFELQNEFPNLTELELNKLDNSIDQLIADISAKTQLAQESIAKRVEEKINLVHSKSI